MEGDLEEGGDIVTGDSANKEQGNVQTVQRDIDLARPGCADEASSTLTPSHAKVPVPITPGTVVTAPYPPGRQRDEFELVHETLESDLRKFVSRYLFPKMKFAPTKKHRSREIKLCKIAVEKNYVTLPPGTTKGVFAQEYRKVLRACIGALKSATYTSFRNKIKGMFCCDN